MIERQERRAPGVNRVPVLKLVDICGRDATVPAFEAESVELSGRGIRVRTPFLPPLGAPLVCRLEDGGHEIVVEGVVAWQKDREGGGEFGVQFTALDSGSVESLKKLCGLADGDGKSSEPVEPPSPPDPNAAPGDPVKLHIDGLGAPMKARVRTGATRRRVQVGSNLEFLKLGRGLEVEDVDHGGRRGAKIDAVSIAIDPATQVPQLVVALRYAGEETTPEPSVVGDTDDEVSALDESVAQARSAPARSQPPPSPMANASEDEEDDGDDDESVEAFRGKVDQVAAAIGSKAKSTGEELGRVGMSAAHGFVGFLGRSRERLAETVKNRAAKRRSTARAPVAAQPGQRRLRPQNGAPSTEPRPGPSKKLIAGTALGGAFLLIAVGVLALGRPSKDAHASASSVPAMTAEPPAGQSTLSTSASPTPGAAVATAPNAMVPSFAGAQPGATTNTPANGAHTGVVANVPLFGPTPMATLEPAPLGPAPDDLTGPPEKTKAPMTAKSDEFPESADTDESFDSSSKKHDKADKSDKSDDEEKTDGADPESVKPFLQGKLHLPVIHRLKLDKPGAALEGTKQASGFTVLIPGRKVTESGTSITKRDDRILDVKTKNGPEGAKITFVFHGNKVPGYKVRLKKSYIEFFISAPDGAK